MDQSTQDGFFKLALDADVCLTSPANKFVMSPSAVVFTTGSDTHCTSTPFVGACHSPATVDHDDGFCTPSIVSYPKTKKSLCKDEFVDLKTSLFSTNLNDEHYGVTTVCSDKQDLRTKRKRVLSEDSANSSNHLQQEDTMDFQKDLNHYFEPIFPNFITQSKPLIETDVSQVNDTVVSADSGLGSLNSSLNYSGVEFNTSQNVTLDSNLCCTEVVESPMKRLALMSLENHQHDCRNFNIRINTPNKNLKDVTTSPVKTNKLDLNIEPANLKNYRSGDFPKRNLDFEIPSSHPLPTKDKNSQFAKPLLLGTNFKARRRDGKKPSLTKSSRQSTIPLKPIIGARLGERYIDFVTELGDMNLHHVISKIFAQIRLKDVFRCSMVCESWSTICFENCAVRKQLTILNKQYQEEEKLRGSENITAEQAAKHALLKSPMKNDDENSQLFYNRRPFSNVQKEDQPVLHKMKAEPTTPSGKNHFISAATKFEHNQQVVKTLDYGERPVRCPKCGWTAKVYGNSSNEAQCYRTECRYRFCVMCETDCHCPNACPVKSQPPIIKKRSTSPKAGSKKSMMRLKKRLLV